MSYEVRLSPAAARQFRKLPPDVQRRAKAALEKVAARAQGERGGRSLKIVRGKDDRFYRPRAGDHRIMFDILEQDGVLLVLGIVDRRDLERWLRGR